MYLSYVKVQPPRLVVRDLQSLVNQINENFNYTSRDIEEKEGTQNYTTTLNL